MFSPYLSCQNPVTSFVYSLRFLCMGKHVDKYTFLVKGFVLCIIFIRNQLPQKVMAENNKKHLLTWIVSLDHEFRSSLATWFWLGDLMLQSSESLTGFGGSTSGVVLSQDWQVGAGGWQEASVPLHVGLFIELLKWPRNTNVGFPQNEWSKRIGWEPYGLLWPGLLVPPILESGYHIYYEPGCTASLIFAQPLLEIGIKCI